MEDPVEARADDSEDLYDVAAWEPRTALDRLAVTVYRVGRRLARWAVYVLGIVISGTIVVVTSVR